MALKLSTGLQKQWLNSGFKPAFDSTGVISLYTGTQPTHADDAPNSLGAVTLLGTFTLSSTSFASASGSGPSAVEIDANGITSIASAAASGTAAWFRMQLSADQGAGSSTTALRLDGDCGTSSGIMSFDSTSITSGQVVACNSCKFFMPAF